MLEVSCAPKAGSEGVPAQPTRARKRSSLRTQIALRPRTPAKNVVRSMLLPDGGKRSGYHKRGCQSRSWGGRAPLLFFCRVCVDRVDVYRSSGGALVFVDAEISVDMLV